MKLLHLSDPHFCSNNYLVEPYKVNQGLIEFIRENIEESALKEFYLIVTGDITSTGNSEGYKEATKFFEKIIDETKILRENVFVCPGNHDICNNSFESFDCFSYGLRQNSDFLFENKPNQIYFQKNICFLGINTSYDSDYKRGKVDLPHLNELLIYRKNEINEANTRVAFFHHHILNILDDDNSATKNSYNLIHLLSEYKFNIIFHGHQHAKQLFDINGIKVHSISSLLDKDASSNLIGLYTVDIEGIQTKEEFIFCQDELNKDGTRGRYRKLC